MKVALLLAIAFIGCGGEQAQKSLESDEEMPAIAADGGWSAGASQGAACD